MALAALPGCGVCALIVAAVAGAIVATRDGGSSRPGTAAGSPFLSPPPSRETLRLQGNAAIVPVCYQPGGAGAEDVAIEFAREAEDFAAWRAAARFGGAPPESPCGGAATFWWDADLDLGLGGRAERVKVRILSAKDPLNPSVSPVFFAGNTPPEIAFVPLSDDEGPITVSFSARDGEGDPLEDLKLFHGVIAAERTSCEQPAGGVERAGERLWPAQPAVLEASTLARSAGASEEEMLLTPPLPRRLPAPENGLIYSRSWNSRDATGNRNANGLQVRLECRDAFGRTAGAALSLDLHNNHPPEVRFLGSTAELDSSFEIPIPFRLFDEDWHPADVVVQYAISGGGRVECGRAPSFPPLPPELTDRDQRRRLLHDPAEAPRRCELQIATPARRTPGEAEDCELAALAGGVEHAFVWDSARDLPPGAASAVRVRLTPFDEERGQAADSPGELVVDNDVFPAEVRLAEGNGPVNGTALGDLDGDGRPDLAVSLVQAESFPGDPSCAAERGRVDVYFREADGSISREPLSLVPGEALGADPCTARDRGPLDLLIADVSGDGRNDLLVLDSNCPQGRCQGVQGDVSIFLGRAPPERLAAAPDAVLAAGGDVRAMAVGDLDGDGRLDIAVSNHDNFRGGRPVPRGVGAFLHAAGGGFLPMAFYSECEEDSCAAGLLACADFTGDGRDDIAVRLRERNKVLIVQWDTAAGELVPWASVQLDRRDPDHDLFSPTSLAPVDLDADGSMDLAVGSRDARAVFLLSNAGERRFELSGKVCLDDSPEKLVAADATGDGRPDLIALEQVRLGGVAELAQIGPEGASGACCPASCSFKEILVPAPADNALPPAQFAAGDLNGDGRLDLLFGTRDGASLFVGEGPGAFSPGRDQVLQFDISSKLHDLLLGDFNGDGLKDLAVALSRGEEEEGRYEVLVFHQSRGGGLPLAPSRVLESRFRHQGGCKFFHLAFLAQADLDGDGSSDVIALSREAGVDLFWKEGGGFPASPTGSIEDCGIRAPLPAGPIVLGRFGGDGEVDLLRLDSYGDAGSLAGRLFFTSLARAPGKGSRAGLRIEEKQPLATEELPLSMAAGDLDGDGLGDLVLYHGLSGAVSLLRQDPGKQWPLRFQPSRAAVAEPGDGRLHLTDLDGDGRADVLLEAGARVLGYCLARPEDSPSPDRLEETVALDIGRRPLGSAAADLTGDGRADIAVLASGEQRVRLYFHGGDGFGPGASWLAALGSVETGEGRLVAEDVTGDSRPELIAFLPAGHEVRILGAR